MKEEIKMVTIKGMEETMDNKNFSQLIKKANTDEWYTPEYAVDLIIPYLSRRGYRKILCPFDKEESNFVKRLTEEGFDVTYSHIENGTDFFEIDNLTSYDCIVSNPPFSKRDKIFRKLFESGVPFAVITNMNGLFDSKARWKLFKDNKFEILVPRGRIKFTNNECEKSSPNFQSIYICNNVLDKQIEFCDMNIDRQAVNTDNFLLYRWDEEYYIIHRDSGTIVNWYKHLEGSVTNDDIVHDAYFTDYCDLFIDL